MPYATNFDSTWCKQVSNSLLAWFAANRRDLPWRVHYRPYEVLVSEVMLQQTQMQRVVFYFTRFMTRFPTLQDLAQADLDEVLELWQGLGYYRRAKNLHSLARKIMADYDGKIPSSCETLQTLPGIGPYTAAAIAAIAFEAPCVGLDANVLRVLARLFDCEEDVSTTVGKKIMEDLALKLLPQGRACEYQQALMELGALICGRSPRCRQCPWKTSCLSHAHGTVSQRPVKAQAVSRLVRYQMAGLVFDTQKRLLLCRQPDTGIWANLLTLPDCEATQDKLSCGHYQAFLAKKTGLLGKAQNWHLTLKHSYTKWQIFLQVWAYIVPQAKVSAPFVWVEPADFSRIPMPSPHRTALQRYLDNFSENIV